MTHTSTEQPEALRLADQLRAEWKSDALNYDTALEAESELRRLHAREHELEADLNGLRKFMEVPTIEKGSQDWVKCDPAIAFHLIERHADNWADAGMMMQEFADAKAAQALRAPLTVAEYKQLHHRLFMKLGRKPLTDEMHLVRAIEAHHGITQEAQG